MSSSRPSLYSRPVLLDDELKLTLKFDNCPSKNLPTKLQLEICDSEGNVVFRKRQNIYYVKLQVKKEWFFAANLTGRWRLACGVFQPVNGCSSTEKDDFDHWTHLLVKIHNACCVYLQNKPGPSVSW